MAVAADLRLMDALRAACGALLDVLDGDAVAISRVLGDVLVLVLEESPQEKPLQVGGGFLVSEFPETVRVLRNGGPRSVCAGDAAADVSETKLLEQLGYGALLMLPLRMRGETWGLVEIYRAEPRPFGVADEATAERIVRTLETL